jgi:hypothetical protein
MECLIYCHVISVTDMIIAVYFGNLKKVRLNTMPKAILELEMPESCTECMFKECLNRTTSVEVSRCIILHKMHVPGSYCPAEGRQADCPLKLVEDKEVE